MMYINKLLDDVLNVVFFFACKVYLYDGNKIVFVTDVKKETSKFFPGAVK